ncbi:Zona pellucida sperm-binding protein 3 [Channa argus]|uniref:Zona pellucida sperm-binding protein 3 n=1 Tax=Channa argus TaxID=215402 RepID=A0A6G1PFL3_CHAAH|nr:Zona pellucida sperm-binding protein 3 [Channa argus]
MEMKCTAVCLVALSLLGSFCDAQWRDIYRPSPRMHPMPRTSPTNQQTSQNIQQQQNFEKPLKWHYPPDPTFKPPPVVPFQPKTPVAVASVSVVCRDHDAHVEVKQDLFGIGQLINPADIYLGTCTASSVDTVAHVLIFETELQNCGSSLSMTRDTLIYTFTVNYNPRTHSNAPVVRTSKAAVLVECHYPRFHNVSSLPLDPLWRPFSAVKVAGEYLYFNLTLMTDDWLNVRPSYQYILGDMINIQASVKQYYHVPLRVYVDNCIATLSPDTSSNPSYVFIVNGCLLDARLTGSTSKFKQRMADNILQFQLEAFRFQDATSGVLYITCHLIATSAANNVDSNHRACSYINGVWSEASGANAACSSCESGAIISSGPSVITGTGTSTGSSGPPYGTSTGSSGPPYGTSTGSSGPPYGTSTGSSGYPPGTSTGSSGYPPGTSTGSSGYPPGTSTGSSGHPHGTSTGSQYVTPYGRKTRDVPQSEIFEWEADVCLGPFQIEEMLFK